MRFRVEPSPSGGYFVRLAGVDAPVSRHDTEEEAEAAAASYDRGVRDNRVGDLQRLRDGGEVLIRAVRAEDKPLFVRGWERFGAESRYLRFMGVKGKLSTSELSFFTEIDHVDHEAIGALDPDSGEGLGVERYVRDRDRPHAAEAAVSVIDAMQGRGLGGLLLRRLCQQPGHQRLLRLLLLALGGERQEWILLRHWQREKGGQQRYNLREGQARRLQRLLQRGQTYCGRLMTVPLQESLEMRDNGVESAVRMIRGTAQRQS